MNDLISRRAAIDALWEALYEYEDETKKQFQESEDLDVEDWIEHRIFVQNMNDIDRQTILNLPSAEPERKKGRWNYVDPDWRCSECGKRANINEWFLYDLTDFCPNCGSDMRGEEDGRSDK